MDALVAYWFFRRFGIGEESLGLVFFAAHILNAVSHLGAAWLARHIGLVKTMVFTSFAFEPFSDCGPIRTLFKSRDPVIPLPRSAGLNGCAPATVLRCGGGYTE
jgi:hypothetical protein